jgi:hypothetical protein
LCRRAGWAGVNREIADSDDADTAFDVLESNLSTLGATVPTLYRQCTDL